MLCWTPNNLFRSWASLHFIKGISVDGVEDFRTMPVILHSLELLDVVVPDQGAREQRGELRVPQRVPDNLVLGMGCITDTDVIIYRGGLFKT